MTDPAEKAGDAGVSQQSLAPGPGRASNALSVIATAIALGLLALVAGTLVWRLPYGVGLNDEPFYVVMARDFAAGARPFADNYTPHQMFAWLVAPCVWGYQRLTGGSTGLVIALRVLWLGLSCGVSAVVFAFVRKVVDWRIALVSALMPVALVPLCIVTVSYDTLASIFLAAGIGLAGIGALEDGRWWATLAGGAFIGLAGITYPTLTVVAVLAIAGYRLASGSWRKAGLLALGAGFIAAFVALLLLPTLSSLHFVVDLARDVPIFAGGADKVEFVLGRACAALAVQPAAWLALAALVWRLAVRRRPPWLLVAAIALAAAWPLVTPTVLQAGTTAWLLLLGALAVGWDAPSETADRVVTWGLAVGLVSAVLYSYTSTNGFVAGAFAASSVAWLALAVLLDGVVRARAPGLAGAWRLPGATALAAVLIAGSLFALATATFQDDPPASLTARVGAGPLAGMRTTPERAGLIGGLSRDLATVHAQSSRVFGYDDFALACLLAGGSASPQPWVARRDAAVPAAVALITGYMEMPGRMPQVVVKRLLLVESDYTSQPNGYDRWVAQHYRPVIFEPDYVVMVRR